MTKRSYITLCIVAIIYIIMASTAILSPHGSNFSAAGEVNRVIEGVNDQFEGIDSKLVITNNTGIEVEFDLLSMPALAAETLQYPADADDSESADSFTAVAMSRIISFSALSVGNSVILTDAHNETYTLTTDDLTANAYLVYADGEKQPLSSEYGSFCMLVLDGENAGLYKDIAKISLG